MPTWSPSANANKRIAALFPFEVSVSAMARDGAAPACRSIAERRAARRLEFIRGRLCARRAIAGFDVAGYVGRLPDGAPHWPEGVVGSISHTNSLCAAVVARTSAARSVGLDIERNGAAAPELRALILTHDESPPVKLFGADNWLTALFSAKEAAYKSHSPLYRQFLDFRDWRTAFHPRSARFGSFTIENSCSQHAPLPGIGFWCFDEAHIYTGFSIPAEAD